MCRSDSQNCRYIPVHGHPHEPGPNALCLLCTVANLSSILNRQDPQKIQSPVNGGSPLRRRQMTLCLFLLWVISLAGWGTPPRRPRKGNVQAASQVTSLIQIVISAPPPTETPAQSATHTGTPTATATMVAPTSTIIPTSTTTPTPSPVATGGSSDVIPNIATATATSTPSPTSAAQPGNSGAVTQHWRTGTGQDTRPAPPDHCRIHHDDRRHSPNQSSGRGIGCLSCSALLLAQWRGSPVAASLTRHRLPASRQPDAKRAIALMMRSPVSHVR